MAKETKDLVGSTAVELNHDWGLDHGAWTVIRHMYPKADIPILQISIDYTKDIAYHYALAKELSGLRKKGVLIIGSGNMVHNLRMVAWNRLSENNFGYDWAFEINETFKKLIIDNDHEKLIQYPSLGKEALMAIPTPEHYIPLIYNMGLKARSEEISFFNDKAVGGSITMTSVKVG